MQALSFAISFLPTTAMFALLFKWMPDANVEWRDVILGAVGTAALFEFGKFIISYYIGKQGLDSTYGASASIVVVLIWVYYSAQILCSVRNSLMLALSRDRASLSSETWSARQ